MGIGIGFFVLLYFGVGNYGLYAHLQWALYFRIYDQIVIEEMTSPTSRDITTSRDTLTMTMSNTEGV